LIISFSILLKHFIFIWFEFVWKGITFSKFSKIFLIFAIQNFCKQFKETKLTIFNFFIRESFTQSASLWCRFLPTSTSDPKTSFAATTSSETQWGKAFLHTHTLWYCCEFQESKRLKCPSLVSTLKLRRNCTSSSLFCLQKLQFAGVRSFKGATSTSQHLSNCTLPGRKHLHKQWVNMHFFSKWQLILKV